MRAPAAPPRPAAPRRAGWLVAALAASAALHAGAVAAILLWPGGTLPEAAGEAGGVALVFADTVALAGGPPAPQAPPPAPATAPEAPSPPAPPPATPAPADAREPPMPEAPRHIAASAIPLPEDPLPPPPAPPPPAPRPPEPAAAPARQEDAARPPVPPPARRAAPGPVRLDAGAGALPDPSLGARATGAVVPPAAAAEGHRNAPPEYPPDSRRRGEEGVVRLMLSIAADGQVTEAELAASSGHAALDRAALAAARRWRFRPATQAGLPVAATLGTAVHFRLRDR